MSGNDVAALRDRWETRARENAMYYIHADRTDWSPAEFLASGEADVARLADPVLPLLRGAATDQVALDIGCGLGRLTRALATRFARAEGIDISSEMVRGAATFDPAPPVNARFQVCDGSGAIPLPDAAVGFVFSYIVFQHVPTRRIVDRYLAEIGRVLTPGGLAHVQVNTATRRVRERFRAGIVPSEKVPLLHRKLKLQWQPHSSMGVVIPAGQCRAVAEQAGLRLERITGAGTQYTWLTLRKPA